VDERYEEETRLDRSGGARAREEVEARGGRAPQLSKEKLAQRGVTGEEIKARLARLPGTVLLIMDCCYAGSCDAPGKKKRALPTEPGDLVRELVSDD
jgi:hypothetical protein